MSQVVVGIVALIAMGLVAYPLFRPKKEFEEGVDGHDEDTELEGVLIQREGVYSAIKELDQDYQMGNLSDRDYRDLRDSYKLKAAMVLKQIDEMAPVAPPEVEDEIERSVRKVRSNARPKTRAGIRYCSGCGSKVSSGDRFCAGCGLPVASGCPGCGAEIEPGDSYCASCGSALTGGRRG